MVVLLKLKEFAENYFYTTEEDEELFRDYLQYMYYSNGVIGLDTENPPSYYYRKTTYYKGTLILDVNFNGYYDNGGLDGDEDIILNQGAGKLWVTDGT